MEVDERDFEMGECTDSGIWLSKAMSLSKLFSLLQLLHSKMQIEDISASGELECRIHITCKSDRFYRNTH